MSTVLICTTAESKNVNGIYFPTQVNGILGKMKNKVNDDDKELKLSTQITQKKLQNWLSNSPETVV